MAIRIRFLAAAIAGLLLVSPASAATVRTPASGTPALVVEAPPYWAVRRDDVGNVYFTAPDRTAILVANITDAKQDKGASTVADFAKLVFDMAGVKSMAEGEEVVLGDIKGRVYTGIIITEAGVTVRVRSSVFRVDADYFAAISELRTTDVTADADQALTTLRGRFAIER